MLRQTLAVAALSLISSISTPSSALPPNAAKGLRPGANHHTGDDGFVAHLGRAPKLGEEKLRMHEHFVAVRARLAGKPATRPELEAKRQKILAFLDAYIAKGTTPDNTHLPWTTPVFIDDAGTICAVGYLIEQSAGRPLAEQIAAKHRYDYIEDIAKDMPEVRAWALASGFTLDELGQIQPGYMGPDVLQWHPTDLATAEDLPEGCEIRRGKLEGAWTYASNDDVVLGRGELHRGNGTWTSVYPSGKVMARGALKNNAPSGPWRMFHESGNLAAEGTFVRGQRAGRWKFYYDTTEPTPIAIGAFTASGSITGAWKHFDDKGALLATSTDATPAQWSKTKQQLFWSMGYLIDVVPGPDKIHHEIHQGSIDGNPIRLDMLSTGDGKELVYLRDGSEDAFDRDGKKLVRIANGWRADDCHWSTARKHAARVGDVTTLHGLIYEAKDEACTEGAFVSKARAERISQLVDSMAAVRAVSPKFIQKLALGERDEATDDDGKPITEDLMHVIASNMSLDIEWPHVDRRFVQLYRTLPGYHAY